MKRDSEFESFVRRRRGHLVSTATALTAGDRFLAEDLVQRTLVRVYLAWSRARAGNVDAYAHRVLVNAFIDHRRRPFVRHERTVETLPEVSASEESRLDIDDSRLYEALAALPPGMRAVVVLRHVSDLSVEDTAAALGCSTGSVKSQTSRGIAKLREALEEHRQPATTSPYGDLS